MKKEKVLRIDLPDGAEYRKVKVTGGSVSIFYAEEYIDQTDKVMEASFETIPKPEPLIGGTDPYHRDDETDYWYCKIKDGRDEFMYLYFDDLTEDDLLYVGNGEERRFPTDCHKEFKANVLKSLKNKPKKGFTWIPVYEPSKDENGNLQYVSGKDVLRGLNSYQWEELFKDYSPENASHMASKTTYFLLLLRWLKDGLANGDQLAIDSTEIGHFWNSMDTKHDFEKTGEREFGGLEGFVGNTYKIVKDTESGSGISFVGSSCRTSGNKCPLSYVGHYIFPNRVNNDGVGLLELDK